MLLASRTVAAEEPTWTVNMVARGGEKWLLVEGRALCVDLSEKHAWTIRSVRLDGREIVGPHGANGSVVNAIPLEGMDPKDPWIGTGHGKERIKSYTIVVDGKRHAYRAGTTLSGNRVVLRKVSNLGPLDHEAEIVLAPGGNRFSERHVYTVVEDLARRFRFVYVFMHCNNNALDRWLAILADGTELEGAAGRGDNRFLLKRDARAVLFYGPTVKRGVAYVYPEVYGGQKGFSNAIWDRKHDNKLYFRPAIDGAKTKVGARLEFRVEVIPFAAGSETWRDLGRKKVFLR